MPAVSQSERVRRVIAGHCDYSYDGYRRLYLPLHPSMPRSSYVPEHRVVAERHLGRLLTAEEEVHHINGVRTDNRPENIQVVSRREHRRIHARLVSHCPQGHPYDEANTYYRPGSDGWHRGCRACRLDAGRRFAQRKAALLEPLDESA